VTQQRGENGRPSLRSSKGSPIQIATAARSNTDLDGAQRARFAIFFAGEDCLQVKFQAVKNAVKGQYGQDSPQFAEVKGIKW
jgi:hypothetical protein